MQQRTARERAEFNANQDFSRPSFPGDNRTAAEREASFRFCQEAEAARTAANRRRGNWRTDRRSTRAQD